MMFYGSFEICEDFAVLLDWCQCWSLCHFWLAVELQEPWDSSKSSTEETHRNSCTGIKRFVSRRITFAAAFRCLLYIYIMSASHEKSPTEKHYRSAPLSSKSILLFCDRGASLCNPGLLAGDVKIQKKLVKSVVPSDGPNPSRTNRASGWHKPTKSPDRRLTVG